MIYINGKRVGHKSVTIQPTDFSKATARPEFVMNGKTFYDATGQLQEGTLVNYSAADICIRFSEHADGTDFSETWSEGKNYIGYALAKAAPASKAGYTWEQFIK